MPVYPGALTSPYRSLRRNRNEKPRLGNRYLLSLTKVVGVPLPPWILHSAGSAGLRFPRKTERFLKLLHDLIHNRAGKCPFDHPQSTGHEVRFVEKWISAAFGSTVFIDAAKIILQEWAGRGPSLPGIVTVGVRVFQVCLDKFLALHSEDRKSVV